MDQADDAPESSLSPSAEVADAALRTGSTWESVWGSTKDSEDLPKYACTCASRAVKRSWWS